MTVDTRLGNLNDKLGRSDKKVTTNDNNLSKNIASFAVVPPEGKATADYMEGLFDLDHDDNVQLHSSKNNISPSMLKKRIEVLQHGDKR